MPLSDEPPDELHRLRDAWYRGAAWVHWTMTIHERQTGWLTPTHHGALRELLIHVCARYHLVCPAYCLMPDHAHFLLLGLSDCSDQRNAVKLLRRYWNLLLARSGMMLQKQAYDHVLQDDEKRPDAFEDTMSYVFHNPVRARLVDAWTEWEYLGAIAAGYPDLDPRGKLTEFRERFWKIHHKERRRLQGE